MKQGKISMSYSIYLMSIAIILLFITSISNSVANAIELKTNDAIDQTKLGDNFIIEFTSTGGFASAAKSIFYNSTDNHLLEKDFYSNETLNDTQLSKEQEKSLKKAIEESNFFNIKKNISIGLVIEDVPYLTLKVTSVNRTNTIYGSSLPEASKLVDILNEYSIFKMRYAQK